MGSRFAGEALPGGLLTDAQRAADARPTDAAFAQDSDVPGDGFLSGTDGPGVRGEQAEDFVVGQAAPVEKGRGLSSPVRMSLQSATQPSQM